MAATVRKVVTIRSGPEAPMPKAPPPTSRVDWPRGAKLGGTPGALRLGQKVKLHVHGTVKGMAHHDYGGHVEVQLHKIDVEPDADDSSMAGQVAKMQPGLRRRPPRA